MTDKLSNTQMLWLRGLALSRTWTSMSASELGNPEVSELQSLELVKIRFTDHTAYEWVILPEGLTKLEEHRSQTTPQT